MDDEWSTVTKEKRRLAPQTQLTKADFVVEPKSKVDAKKRVIRFTKEELISMRKPRDILASMKDIPDIVSIDALEPECNTPMDPEDVLRLWQQQNNAKRITARGGEKVGGAGGGNNNGAGGGGEEWSRGNNSRDKGDIWDAVGGASDFELSDFAAAAEKFRMDTMDKNFGVGAVIMDDQDDPLEKLIKESGAAAAERSALEEDDVPEWADDGVNGDTFGGGDFNMDSTEDIFNSMQQEAMQKEAAARKSEEKSNSLMAALGVNKAPAPSPAISLQQTQQQAQLQAQQQAQQQAQDNFVMMRLQEKQNAMQEQIMQQKQQQQREAEIRLEQLRLEQIEQQKKNEEWMYRDPQGNVQGPFNVRNMRQWHERNYFMPDLPIKLVPWSNFYAMRVLFPNINDAFLSVPREPLFAPDILSQEQQQILNRQHQEQQKQQQMMVEQKRHLEMIRQQAIEEQQRLLIEQQQQQQRLQQQQMQQQQQQQQREAQLRAQQEEELRKQQMQQQMEREEQLRQQREEEMRRQQELERQAAVQKEADEKKKKGSVAPWANASANKPAVVPVDKLQANAAANAERELRNSNENKPAWGKVTKAPSLAQVQKEDAEFQAKVEERAKSGVAAGASNSLKNMLGLGGLGGKEIQIGSAQPQPRGSGGGNAPWANSVSKAPSITEIMNQEEKAAKQQVDRPAINSWAAKLGGGTGGVSTSKPQPATDSTTTKNNASTPTRNSTSNSKPQSISKAPSASSASVNVNVSSTGSASPSKKKKENSSTNVNSTASNGNRTVKDDKKAANKNTTDFGTSGMPQEMAQWCEKELKSNFPNMKDLTLLEFCYSLENDSEVKEYLSTYLGSSSQVRAFATEFLTRKKFFT